MGKYMKLSTCLILVNLVFSPGCNTTKRVSKPKSAKATKEKGRTTSSAVMSLTQCTGVQTATCAQSAATAEASCITDSEGSEKFCQEAFTYFESISQTKEHPEVTIRVCKRAVGAACYVLISSAPVGSPEYEEYLNYYVAAIDEGWRPSIPTEHTSEALHADLTKQWHTWTERFSKLGATHIVAAAECQSASFAEGFMTWITCKQGVKPGSSIYLCGINKYLNLINPADLKSQQWLDESCSKHPEISVLLLEALSKDEMHHIYHLPVKMHRPEQFPSDAIQPSCESNCVGTEKWEEVYFKHEFGSVEDI